MPNVDAKELERLQKLDTADKKAKAKARKESARATLRLQRFAGLVKEGKAQDPTDAEIEAYVKTMKTRS